jgi:hypothetical protein
MNSTPAARPVSRNGGGREVMLGGDPYMAVLQTLDLIRWGLSRVGRRQKALDGVGACQFARQCWRRLEYHPVANAVSVGRSGQGLFPFSAFAASSPSSISRRMASARDATRLEKRKSSTAATSDFGIGVMTRSELGSPITQ